MSHLTHPVIPLQRLKLLKSAAQYCWDTLRRKGWIVRNDLPRVSAAEHSYLCANFPRIASLTRSFHYADDEYLNDPTRPGESQRPQVREVWVGARSLATLREDEAFEEENGRDPAKVLEDEDLAELSEFSRLQYNSKGGAMIEDPDTGVLRPIRVGDVIQTVRGSNDDLDELFRDEPDDPRDMGDLEAAGSDHKWSDRFRANTELEHNLLTGSTRLLPSTLLMDEGLAYEPSDAEYRRAAQKLAAKQGGPNLLGRTDAIEARLRLAFGKLQIEHGEVVRGYFASKSEYFGAIEALSLGHHRPVKRPRKLILSGGREVTEQTCFHPPRMAPAPVDWSVIRNA